MPEYDNTNRFSLFPNKDKTEANPTWADFQGTINIEGVEYYISAWKPKAGANPKGPVLSGSVKPKEGGGQKKAAPTADSPVDIPNPGDADAFFEDIPLDESPCRYRLLVLRSWDVKHKGQSNERMF